MNTTENESTAKPAEDFTRTWRYKVGLFMIIAGNGIIVLALFMPVLGFGAGVVGAMVVGGEVISLGSIVFLGKEGFKAIKAKVFGFIKAGYAASVGPTRHYIGVVLLCANALTTYLTAIYAWFAFESSTVEDPTPVVFGLDFAQQGDLVFWLFLIGELSFLIAIYVLGADWWGKFRNIFVWQEANSD